MATDELPGQLPLFDEPAGERWISQRGTLRKLREENQKTYTQLVAAGTVPDPQMVLSIRLETLIDILFVGPDRTRYDLAFESQMREVLTACQQQVSRAQLLAPTKAGPPGGGLIIPAH